MSGPVLNGRCLCGAVTLSMEAKRPEIHACHCRMCQRWAGSVFLEIDADPGTLKASGPIRAFRSSDWAERASCAECGSPLWYHLTVPGTDFHAVAIGLFDDLEGFALTKEIYVDHKPDGFAFAGDHPRQTEAEFHSARAAKAAVETGAGDAQ